MKLNNKTILITGGTSGIGWALANVLVAQNNRVLVTGRDPVKLEQAQHQLTQLTTIQADVSIPAEIDQLFLTLQQKGIVLNVLFNNAGVIETWDIGKDPLASEVIFSKLNTNLAGAVAMTSRFIHQADADKDNYIINITSEAAIMPVPILPLYSVSKAGLSVFTQALRAQLKGTRFKVVEIIPPAVETRMTTQDLKNTTKLTSPAVFAGNMVKQIEAGKLTYAPSGNALVLRFLRRVMPAAGLSLVDRVSRNQLLG